MKEPPYLFVYGTLRRDFGSSFSKEYANEMEHVGVGTIYGQLFDIGEYPGAIPGYDANSLIEGDVLKLKNADEFIKILDEYENFNPLNPVDSEYVRVRMKARMSDGTTIDVWVYFYNKALNGKTRIEETNYLIYLKNKLRNSEV